MAKKAKKKTKKKIAKKATKKKAVKKKPGQLSRRATKDIIKLLRSKKGGNMSVPEIAKVLGKNTNTIYKMGKGEARLSAEDYGKLVGKISNSLLAQVTSITMKDVRKAGESIVKFAKKELKDARGDADKLRKFSVCKAKQIAKGADDFLKGASSFIDGLRGKKNKDKK